MPVLVASLRTSRTTLSRFGKLVDGPVSGEVTAEDRDGMIEQGRTLAALAR